jgi:uncharacterized membrane protein
MMRISELKQRAKDNLTGQYGIYLVICIIVWAINSAVGGIPIGALLVTGPLTVGMAYAFLKLTRGMQGEIGDVFRGFDLFVPAFVMQLLIGIFVILWSLLLIIPGIIMALAYSMAPYILWDNPQLSGYEAIQKSKEMMKGNKGRLFGLYLSFFGWFLLCIMTAGIGFIFLAPWVQASVAAFYQDLLDQETSY